MKGAFEYALLMLVGIPLVCVVVNLGEVAIELNQARVLQESVVAILEHQNRYDEQVALLIAQETSSCKSCEVHVQRAGLRYQVEVEFPIQIQWLNLKRKGLLKTYTYYIG